MRVMKDSVQYQETKILPASEYHCEGVHLKYLNIVTFFLGNT